MKIVSEGATLTLRGSVELNAANAGAFREEARAALTGEHKQIHVDLSQMAFIDSSGLGALIALHKTMCARQGMVRLLNPTPSVLQILELTRLHRIFEIVRN